MKPVFLVVIAAVALTAQPPTPAIKIQPVRRNLFMLVGDGANIAVQTEPPAGEESYDGSLGGDTGVLVVDTGTAAASAQLLGVIRGLSKGPLRYIINTSAAADHTGGNETLAKASGGIQRGALGGRPPGPPLMIFAHEAVLEAMGKTSPLDGWPTDAFASEKEVFFNGGSLKIWHQPGLGAGDSIVYLRRADVICAGELFSTTGFPPFDPQKGGSIQGILDGLNRILDLAIPGEKQQGGTLIIPAHGRLADEADVEYYREMVQIVRDRVAEQVRLGKSLADVEAAQPALEYDKRYSQPGWTATDFVAAIFTDLAARKAAPEKKR